MAVFVRMIRHPSSANTTSERRCMVFASVESFEVGARCLCIAKVDVRTGIGNCFYIIAIVWGRHETVGTGNNVRTVES
eukprot:scaffold16235_cov30-Attheya_sp.AAC.1